MRNGLFSRITATVEAVLTALFLLLWLAIWPVWRLFPHSWSTPTQA